MSSLGYVAAGKVLPGPHGGRQMFVPKIGACRMAELTTVDRRPRLLRDLSGCLFAIYPPLEEWGGSPTKGTPTLKLACERDEYQ